MVRPVDLQDNLSKAPLAGRLQHLQQDAPEMARRQVDRALAQQQITDQTRPLAGTESGSVALHPERGNPDGRRRPQRRRPPARPPAAAAPMETSPGPNGADAASPHVDVIA